MTKHPSQLLKSYADTLRQYDGVMMIVEDGSVGVAIADALDELIEARAASLPQGDGLAWLTRELLWHAEDEADGQTTQKPEDTYRSRHADAVIAVLVAAAQTGAK